MGKPGGRKNKGGPGKQVKCAACGARAWIKCWDDGKWYCRSHHKCEK